MKTAAATLGVLLLAVLSGTVSAPGVHSAGSPPPRITPVTPVPPLQTCPASLKLVLAPGQHWPKSVGMKVPSDLPPGNVTVHLPQYPGARVATEHQESPDFTYRADLYLKSASAEYQTSDSLATVTTWYLAAFAACGYTLQSSGERSLRGARESDGFVWIDKQGRHEFWMSLSFAHASDGGTLILYVAIDYTPPVYPAPGSILRIPGTPVTLTITRYSGMNPGFGALRPLRTVTVHNGATVASLANEINRLPKLTVSVISCPSDDGRHLTLRFGDAGGSHHVITVNLGGCRPVVAPPAPASWLYDDPKLLPRLLALVNGVGSSRAGYVYDARTLRIVRIRLLAATGGWFLSTGQGGKHLLYISGGTLFMAPAGGGRARLLARGIADASFAMNDFAVLTRPIRAAHRNDLLEIDTKTDHAHALYLAASATLVGRNAGIGQPRLGDAMEYNLQYVWSGVDRRLAAIDPEHPNSDRFLTAAFLPSLTQDRLIAVSGSGDQTAVYRPGAGIAVRNPGSSQGGGGRLVRRLHLGDVSFLSWAPDDTHLAFRSGDSLIVANITTGAIHSQLSLHGQIIHGAAWDPWSHVLALSLAPIGAPVWQSHVELINADGTGARMLALPFAGVTELRWSTFRGQTIEITRATPHGTQAWALSLPPMPRDPGQPLSRFYWSSRRTWSR